MNNALAQSRLAQSGDALLNAAVRAGDVPGVVAAVTRSDDMLYEGAFGERVLGQGTPMSMDTVMWLASMTKPIVGTAAMQLVEQGRISLDEPVARVLPALGAVSVLTGWDASGAPLTRAPHSPITLRQLLTHTAGFTSDLWNADIARYHTAFKLPRAGSGQLAGLNIPLAFDPGTQWEYGISIDWVGQVVEAIAGMKLGEYIHQYITAPLGMSSTAFRITPGMRARMAKVHQREPGGMHFTVTDREVPQQPEFEPGGGGLYSTARDYLCFMRMILNQGTGNGHQLLKPETVALMSHNAMGPLRVSMLHSQNQAVSLDAEFFPGVAKSWGLSVMINEDQAPTGRSPGSLAWAGLANTFFWIDPKKDLAGLVMTQVLPFVDTRTLAVFSNFEQAVYATCAAASRKSG